MKRLLFMASVLVVSIAALIAWGAAAGYALAAMLCAMAAMALA